MFYASRKKSPAVPHPSTEVVTPDCQAVPEHIQVETTEVTGTRIADTTTVSRVKTDRRNTRAKNYLKWSHPI